MSQREATIAQQAAKQQPQPQPQYKPADNHSVQYKPEPQSQPQSQAPTPTPQQSQAPTPPMPQQSQPAPIAQRTITPSSSSYNPPKQHQWTQPPQVPNNINVQHLGSIDFTKVNKVPTSHQHSGLLPPISHVHPQSPPIAIHHNVPAPAIRYGY